MTLPYNPSSKSLFNPEIDETLFRNNAAPSEQAILAECARLAYYRAESHAKQYERLSAALAIVKLSAPVLFVNAETGTYAFGTVDQKHEVATLAFRGTQPDEATDLGTDLTTAFVPWSLGVGEVHIGFSKAYKSVHQPITDWIGALPKTCQLRISGHSLGGALGTLAASNFEPSLLFTIGSPRVGNEKFAASLDNTKHYRYTNCCDVVTRVPPVLFGFKHAGIRHYIDRAGNVVINPSDAFVASDRFNAEVEYLNDWAWRSGMAPFRAAADHSPVNYLRVFF